MKIHIRFFHSSKQQAAPFKKENSEDPQSKLKVFESLGMITVNYLKESINCITSGVFSPVCAPIMLNISVQRVKRLVKTRYIQRIKNENN